MAKAPSSIHHQPMRLAEFIPPPTAYCLEALHFYSDFDLYLVGLWRQMTRIAKVTLQMSIFINGSSGSRNSGQRLLGCASYRRVAAVRRLFYCPRSYWQRVTCCFIGTWQLGSWCRQEYAARFSLRVLSLSFVVQQHHSASVRSHSIIPRVVNDNAWKYI